MLFNNIREPVILTKHDLNIFTQSCTTLKNIQLTKVFPNTERCLIIIIYDK